MINKILVIAVCSFGLLIDLLRFIDLMFRTSYGKRYRFLSGTNPSRGDLVFYYLAMMVLLVQVILNQLER
jgi:hypothetical protein